LILCVLALGVRPIDGGDGDWVSESFQLERSLVEDAKALARGLERLALAMISPGPAAAAIRAVVRTPRPM
jgi:hypothetical protein